MAPHYYIYVYIIHSPQGTYIGCARAYSWALTTREFRLSRRRVSSVSASTYDTNPECPHGLVFFFFKKKRGPWKYIFISYQTCVLLKYAVFLFSSLQREDALTLSPIRGNPIRMVWRRPFSSCAVSYCTRSSRWTTYTWKCKTKQTLVYIYIYIYI